jgi:hypothetical protein
MIRFFRTIRQSLLAQGRITRYLTYAVGEIVLVVVGILIALQVNNWNEQRKEQRVLNDHLSLMVNELKEDLAFYQKQMEGSRRKIVLLNAISTGAYSEVDLGDTPDIISRNYDPRQFGTTYGTLKASGKLNALGESDLRKAMVDYFEVRTVHYNNVSSWHKQFVSQNIESYIMQELPLDSALRTPPDVIIAAMQNDRLRSIVNFQAWNQRRYIRLFEGGAKAAEALIVMIKEHQMASGYHPNNKAQ